MATVAINQDTWYQRIIGGEAVAQTGLGDNLTSGQNYHDEVLDANVDLGVCRLRTELHSGHVENTTDYWLNYETDGRDYSTNTSAAAMSTNRTIPVDVSPGSFKFSPIDWQIRNFVLPLQKKLAVRGETLFWVLCYVHFSTSNQLHVDTPAEYGEMLAEVWTHCWTRWGQVPQALEAYLEPDGTGAVTSAECAAMIKAGVEAIVAAGFAAPYVVAPSTVTSPSTLAYYQGIETADATAFSYINECSRHRYGTQPSDGQLNTLVAAVEADGKVLSQTEAGAGIASGGNSLAGIHQDLKVGHVVTWTQFCLGYPTTDNANQYFIIGAGPGYDVTEGILTKYIRHYFLPIRAGAVMKGVTISGTGSANIDALPFRQANGGDVVVGKCAAAVDFDITGLANGNYLFRYTLGDGLTNPSSYWQSLSDVNVTNGTTSTISMPGAGVFSFYRDDFLTPPLSVPARRSRRRLVHGI